MDGGKGYGLKTHWVRTYQKKKNLSLFVTVEYEVVNVIADAR